MRNGKTVCAAAEEWVSEFNAIPRGMIEKLMDCDPCSWHEVTTPSYGCQVSVFGPSVPGNCDSGCIIDYDESSELYCIEMDDGAKVSVAENEFDVEREGILPSWGTMWSFGDSADVYWLEELDGIRKMSQCGFRVFESDEFGYFFGIDGAGYSFYEIHWCPLYRARGLQWHDSATELKVVA